MLQTYPTYKCGTRKNTCWNNQCSRNGMSLPSGIAREGNFRNGETKMPMVEVLLFLWEPSFYGQVSWTLFVTLFTMNKASGSNGIPVELFQVLKDDTVKCCTQQLWKTQQRPQDWKRSVFIPIPRMLKLPHNCTHLICW